MTDSDRLRIVRRFDVPPRSVFDAFTDPDAMRVWWTPDTVFDLDVRVGGRWRITRRDGVGCVVTFEQTGDGIADELRALPTGATSASEAGWQQGFDLMEGAWRTRSQR